MMWHWEVAVIKPDGNEKYFIRELERVFLQNNAFSVECGNGSFGLLELNVVARIIDERPDIVDDEARQHYKGIEWLNK